MPFVDGIWVDEPENSEDKETEEEPKNPEEENPTPPESVPSTPLQPATPITKPITQSILLTIKKMLGIAEEYHAFDLDIITNINATFFTLNQLGVGPRLPYSITGIDETWSDFLGSQKEFINAVQTYTYMRVRLMFDPPTNSFLVDAMQKQCQEYEWRFTVQPKNEQELQYVESFKVTTHPYDKEDPEEDTDSNDSSSSDDSDKNQNGSSEEDTTQESQTFSLNKAAKKKSLFDIFS